MKALVRKGVAGAGALGLLAGWALWDLPARADAPDTLAVFSASATATPYGVVSRVPAETSGGFLYSGTAVNLGKSRAIAAGFTAGELGDLFIVSSAPPGTITTVPGVITAQEPPSELSPREASFNGGRSGGGGTGGEARNFTLEAAASELPSAIANADGQAVTSPFYSSGYSTSSSDSRVMADGTVVAKAVTTVQDILLGPVGAQLSIGSARSVATVTVPVGKEPVTVLSTQIYGAQLAGVPVVFDENGISVDDQVALPASAMQGFDAALEALAAQGLTFRPVPRAESTTEEGASVSGAAFTFRYQVPTAIPRPSDIGSDQTFSVASVSAAATSRPRSSLGPPPVSGAAPGEVTPGSAPETAGGDVAPAPIAPAPGADSIGGELPTGALPAGDVPVAAPAGTAPGEPAVAGAPAGVDTALFLPTRVTDPLPAQFRDSYRLVLLAAAAGLGAVLVLVRKRPV